MTRYCPDRTIHPGHEWYDPAIRYDCPGLPDDTAVLAARFFDENQAAQDAKAGMPEWMTAKGKAQYIADVAANPQAAHALAVMYAEPEEKP